MKLSAEQIGYVSNYIQSFDIKWYELQVELTDHFVSIMEEIWNEDHELTFHQVKYRAEQRFGRNYFEEVVQERKKILQKEFNRSQRKMVGEYLKFPKIIMSVLGLFLVYNISFYFENTDKFISFLSSIFIFLAVIHLVLWLYFRKIGGQRFLSIEMICGMNNLVLLGWNGFLGITKDYIPTQYKLSIACFLFVLGVLFIITGIHITNKLVSNIKKQYQLT